MNIEFVISEKCIYFELQSTFLYKMKNTELYLSEIKEIRQMMEQSSRFLSLSGLSGILIGIYALIGAFIAHTLIQSETQKAYLDLFHYDLVLKLSFLASVILILSLVTVFLLTNRRAKKSGKKIWNPGSRLMAVNLAIPLVTGAVLIIILLSHGFISLVAPMCLIFYGLALVNASKFTRQEIFYMGLFQIVLGILAVLFTDMGLIYWAIGFGLIHIIYGTVMYFRYEKIKKV